MANQTSNRLTDEQILEAVRDVEAQRFGRVIIKIRNGVACFMEKQPTEQVKPEPAREERPNERYPI